MNVAIDSNVSAIENFIRLSKIDGGRRKSVPLTPVEQPFILFSETDLVNIFWSNPILKDWLSKKVPLMDGAKPALGDVAEWLSTQAPGFLISRLLTDIGRVDVKDSKGKSPTKAKEKRRRRNGPRSFDATTMSQKSMREHLSMLQKPDFDPRSYTDKGYALYGSIRTDGFRLQLLSFKLRELNGVRYHRLSKDLLPDKITSTIGGVDYFLSEIRNVVKTKDDVTRLWRCEPDKVQIIGLDLGQSYVVGASALLPNGRYVKNGHNNGGPNLDGDVQMVELDDPSKAGKFYNFVVKQKAVYQPIFKNRRWMEEEKKKSGPSNSESIMDIENSLPPRAGEGSDFLKHVEHLDKAAMILTKFYNGDSRFKKRKWDAKKALEAEFAVITDRVLSIVGGSVSRRRDESCKVVIAMGLGKFSSNSKLSSLHESFMSYFVQKVSLVNYVIL